MTSAKNPRRPRRRGRSSEAPFKERMGKGLMTIGICWLVNMLTTPSLQWWVIPAFAISCGLFFDWMDEKEGRDRAQLPDLQPVVARPPPLPSTTAEAEAVERRREAERDPFGAEHEREMRRLRVAVEDLHGRLSEGQRGLLGPVSEPVRSLESRVEALVRQGRDIDAELRMHDDLRIEKELDEARRRVQEAPEGARREDERAALAVLEQQHGTLQRVWAQRARIDARLRTAVGMLRALHLDLVECLSTDLEGSSATLRRLGDQVREVSRSVDALAGAVDEVYLGDLPPRAGERSRGGRRRDRDR